MNASAGDWLRDELSRQGISVRAVADALSLRATQTVYAWISGKAAPTDEAAAGLAVLLRIPEVEVRRRFGLWVPEAPEPAEEELTRAEKLAAMEATLVALLADIQEMRRGQ